ncbi:related to Cytochrome c oxidase assembly factor 6 [Saccharomycodes ludwigii]|uniref:Related to Cytochrome c oxidase assembly factor 6 n=1 Tax=Saccharomycodes ludwigii TaxID=36035 RepID=A0A376B133_9ASCO|nr:hypothetical protein SCDLUD_000732 [Saccharomycodes ludwigii]KAH3903120.1 hypothetical protein SCDLUD_000732 [Saccharomycodes ludwigii]SSD58363.1 related to Cytochrome c oxidase assembly factor 6 [Saccharomycodes ludwigii]
MGWFSNLSSKPMDDQTKAPSRSSRKQCWDSRDAYFNCLDKIDVIDSLDPRNKSKISSVCGKQEKKFEYDCATSWIKYFKEKRITDLKKEKIMREIAQNGGQIISMDGSNGK